LLAQSKAITNKKTVGLPPQKEGKYYFTFKVKTPFY
jgi:hypothetical protein